MQSRATQNKCLKDTANAAQKGPEVEVFGEPSPLGASSPGSARASLKQGASRSPPGPWIFTSFWAASNRPLKHYLLHVVKHFSNSPEGPAGPFPTSASEQPLQPPPCCPEWEWGLREPGTSGAGWRVPTPSPAGAGGLAGSWRLSLPLWTHTSDFPARHMFSRGQQVTCIRTTMPAECSPSVTERPRF